MKIVSENQFSGKTYLYTIRPRLFFSALSSSMSPSPPPVAVEEGAGLLGAEPSAAPVRAGVVEAVDEEAEALLGATTRSERLRSLDCIRKEGIKSSTWSCGHRTKTVRR